MNLDFNETQQMLRQSARDFLEKEFPFQTVKELAESKAGHSPELWRKMVDLGWVGLVFPEEYGGAGCSLMDLAALCEELGRGLVPNTFYSTVTAGLAILNGGTEEQKRRYIPQICEGRILLAMALTEPAGSYNPDTLNTRAVKQGSGWAINGTKLFIQDAQLADFLVVVARTNEGKSGDGVSAFIVPTRSSGISISPLVSFGGESQAEVVFNNVKVAEADVLGEPGRAWQTIDKTLKEHTALQLADVVGVGQFIMDTTAEYMMTRVQFGQPLGRFQAVQHHCANMAIDLDASRLIAYEAISLVSKGVPAEKELSMAKAYAPEAVSRMSIIAHRLHGGIGITNEYPLGYYSSRAKGAAQTLGTPIEHLRMVAQQL